MPKVASLWKATYQSKVYKNEASVARDLLASERTYLAWLRTSLNAAALGIVLAKFSVSFTVHVEFAQVLGCILVFLGIIFMSIGYARQIQVRLHLEGGDFPSSALVFTSASALVLAVLIAAFVFLILTDRVNP